MHSISYLISTLAVASTLIPSALAAPTSNIVKRQAPSTCNGQSSLCSRQYSNVSFMGSHDSAFVGPLPTQNQIKSVSDQLNSGARFLTAQTHKFLGIVSMCHTSCWEEFAGTTSSYLSTVKKWLDNNPNEVVTLLWTNPDKLPMSTFDGIVKSVGADKYVFTPKSSPNPLGMGDWPTLGDMIQANTRLVIFIGQLSAFGLHDARKNNQLTFCRLWRQRQPSPISP
jgi:hypothetical protein